MGRKRRLRTAAVGTRCPYCARVMFYNRNYPGRAPTIDRIIPGSQGGTYTTSNIRVVCARCNNDKRHHSLDEWADRLTAQNDYRGAVVRGLATSIIPNYAPAE